MKNLFGLSNVFYELSSEYEFSELNESLYVEKIIKNLIVLMGDEFDEYEFIIFSNHRLDLLPKTRNYITTKRKVLIYLSDEYSRDPHVYADKYYVVFKAYLRDIHAKANVFPFGIGYVKDVPFFPGGPINDRKYNLFFRGNLNKNRIDFYRNFSKFKFFLPSQSTLNQPRYLKFLTKLKSDFSDFFRDSIVMFNSSFKSGFSPKEYGEIISSSKIVLCPKGFDMTECFRHYEAMRSGCVVISERLPNNEFYLDSPIIQIDDWEEGLEIAIRLLLDHDELQRLQKETTRWWEERCSEEAMAKFLVNKIRSLDVL